MSISRMGQRARIIGSALLSVAAVAWPGWSFYIRKTAYVSFEAGRQAVRFEVKGL